MTVARPAGHAHQVVCLRPGAVSLGWLAAAVRASQSSDRLAPVTVVVPTPYVGVHVRRALARRGCANVRLVVQLRQVAERVARAGGVPDADRPLTGPLEAAAIRVAVRQAGGLPPGGLAGHRSLQEALGVLFRELRHRDNPEALLAALSASDGVAAAFTGYEALTAAYPDVPGLARRAARVAARAARAPAWAHDLGALVLYLPSRLDHADLLLLAQLGRHLPIRAALAWHGDALADGLAEEMAAALAQALGTAAVVDASPFQPAEVSLLSAPDAEEETRALVRRLVADLEQGVPLWRMALVYTAEETYGLLVRETLEMAGLPWYSALGRPASAGWAARSLIGLIGLRERRFAREVVLDWLVGRPPAVASGQDDPLTQVPMSAWDRLSRRAQILEGPYQWVQRFERLARTLEAEERQRRDWRVEARGDDGDSDAGAPRPPSDSDHARAIASAVARLDRDTRPPAEVASWDAFVDWALALRQRYVPHDPAWPEAERAASVALDAALASLIPASAFEATTTLHVFRDALSAALDARRLPEGAAGVGVLVGPLGSMGGTSFERVYVLGMAEGLLPGRPVVDPLTSGGDGIADPLGRRERQRQTDRHGLYASLAAGDGGRVTLSYPRSDAAARPIHPSRWLLEQAARREGVAAVYASDLPRLHAEARPWLERIASAYDGLLRCGTPADLGDLRLRGVVAWHALGRGLAGHPLAARTDLPLGRALRAAQARRSSRFTAYDGNVGAVAGTSRLVVQPFTGARGASSASAVERWAGCPFQYLLVHVLRVEATERSQDAWTITPLDRGSVVHAVYERFFRELLAAGRCTPADSFTPADHARLADIAEELFAEIEAQGRTGHPLAWENARAAILADLHAQLDRDETWRRDEGLTPALFEQSFGTPRDPRTWPAVEVSLGDGDLVARFRGAIDRVDLSPEGARPRRALVIDYKTGGRWGYDGLQDDPVLAGRHVQLALYARALRAGLPDGGDLDEVRAEYRFVSSKGEFQRLQIVADASVDARLEAVVRHAAAGIQAGVFLATPGARSRGSFDNCHYCAYDRVCSTTRDEAWERKQAGARGQFIPLTALA